MWVLNSVSSGILLGISFNSPDLWFFAFLAFLPIFHFLYQEKLSLKRIFIGGWVFGTVFLGIAYIPIWQTLPLDWLGVESVFLQILFVFIYWGSLVSSLAVFSGGLWAVAAHLLKRKHFFDAVVFAALWIFFEYARMWWFALLNAGDTITTEPYFSSGFIGYLLGANEVLLQFASIGGVYLLSFIVVFANGALYWFFFHLRLDHAQKRGVFAVGLLVFILFVSLPVSSLFGGKEEVDAQSLKVALVSVYFPSTSLQLSKQKSESRFQTLQGLLQDIKDHSEKVDIVVFQEDSRFLQTLSARGELSLLDSVVEDKEVLFIDTGNTKMGAGSPALQRMLYYNTASKGTISQDKRLFMPVGEYVPYLYLKILRMLGQDELVEAMADYRAYTVGDTTLRSGYVGDIAIGALFCSENFSPTLYANITQSGAEVLVNTSASAWFHKSRILYNQTMNITKVRAVESNRYFVRSANMSPAFAVDNHGRIIAEMPWEETGMLYVTVESVRKQSVYNKILSILAIF